MSPLTVQLRAAIVSVLTDHAKRDPLVWHARRGLALDVLNRGVRVRDSALTNALGALVSERLIERRLGAHGQTFYRMPAQPSLSLGLSKAPTFRDLDEHKSVTFEQRAFPCSGPCAAGNHAICPRVLYGAPAASDDQCECSCHGGGR